MLDINAYLDRIKFRGVPRADIETLRQLHLCHNYSVPFENLNIHYGMPITLDTDGLFEKIVKRRRGGFCYELNGLFSLLLREIGFEVELLSAQMSRKEGGYGPEFDHLTLLIKLEKPWLADVGSGDSFLYPIHWEESLVQNLQNEKFKLEPDGNGRIVLMRQRPAQEWKPCYSISATPRQFSDFFEMCKFHSSSPDSPFSKHKMVRLEQADGRRHLLDYRLSLISFTQEDRDIVVSEHEYPQMLRDYFGIDLNDN